VGDWPHPIDISINHFQSGAHALGVWGGLEGFEGGQGAIKVLAGGSAVATRAGELGQFALGSAKLPAGV
jgi:hypothetical protein